MSKARAMLTRLQKLETSGANPVLAKIGGLESFEAQISKLVADGRMSGSGSRENDADHILKCVRRWTEQIH